MSCQHCLRGDAQNLDISNEAIERALEGVNSIGTITFSGGEPSLVVDRIEYILKQVKKRNISIGNFYLITNGKVASRRLVHALIDWYDYANENEISSLCISKDQYHRDEVKDVYKAERLYKSLAFYNPDDRKEDIKFLINEGRMLGGGTCEALLNDLIIGTNDDGTIEQIGPVYVNAKGNVIPSCDMSFENQEENKLGSVHENTIAEIISRSSVTA